MFYEHGIIKEGYRFETKKNIGHKYLCQMSLGTEISGNLEADVSFELEFSNTPYNEIVLEENIMKNSIIMDIKKLTCVWIRIVALLGLPGLVDSDLNEKQVFWGNGISL